MKSIFICMIIAAFALTNAQTKMYINKTSGGTDSIALSEIKGISFKKITTPNLLLGLVAYYTFSGNAADSSGNSNNGSINNVSFTTDRLGNANEAGSFNGTTSYISVPNSSSLNFGLNNFSICVIFKTSVVPTTSFSSFVTKHNTATSHDTEYNLTISGQTGGAGSGGTVVFGLSTSAGVFERAVSTTNVCDGKYHTVVGVRENGFLKIFVDGTLQATVTATINPNNSNPLNIGRSSYSNGYGYFNGIIDEVRIYNRALNIEEIQMLNP